MTVLLTVGTFLVPVNITFGDKKRIIYVTLFRSFVLLFVHQLTAKQLKKTDKYISFLVP